MASKRDPKFDDGVSARSDFRQKAGRGGAARKTAQLCSQVQRTIEMALLGEVRDELVANLEVVEVVAMPDASRLVVRFRIHEAEVTPANAAAALEASRNVLTAEVAQAISRRKVPDLVFEVVTDPV